MVGQMIKKTPKQNKKYITLVRKFHWPRCNFSSQIMSLIDLIFKKIIEIQV